MLRKYEVIEPSYVFLIQAIQSSPELSSARKQAVAGHFYELLFLQKFLKILVLWQNALNVVTTIKGWARFCHKPRLSSTSHGITSHSAAPCAEASRVLPKGEAPASACFLPISFPIFGGNIKEKERQMWSIVPKRAFYAAGSREDRFGVTQVPMVAGKIKPTIK